MWKEFIKNISEGYILVEPAMENEIHKLEKIFSVEISNELKTFLSESNGVYDTYKCPIIWSVKQIIEENSNLRKYEHFKDIYMPFDCLLFVADAGNGDLFGYSILNGIVQKDDIYVWNHEDDSRTWVASSLKKFIKGWTDGTISV